MTKSRAFPFAPLAACLLSCGGDWGLHDYVTAGLVGGTDRLYTYEEWKAHGSDDVVRDEASREFQCALGELSVDQPYHRAYVITGCGHRGVFVVESLADDQTHKMPGHEDGAYVTWWRAVNVVAPVEPPSAPIAGTMLANAKRWIDLVKQGAKDLECSPGELTPDFVPQGKAPSVPLVEGCGKRAIYVDDVDPNPIRLTSIVPIK